MKSKHILQTGRNCWRIRRADQVAFIIDGANYFRALYETLCLAQQQILLLCWDIHSQLHLIPPEQEQQRPPTRLRDYLNQLVQEKSRLRVNILSWDFSLLYAMSRETLPIYKLDWRTHRRLKFCLDDQYPLGASHHQKVVVLDDQLAFAGGLDLTKGRWDTSEHSIDDPRRQAVDGSGELITPYHDVQIAVSGPAAATLGSLARERWRRGTDKKLAAANVATSIWPESLSVDLKNVDVAVARTEPAYAEFSQINEVEQLYLDSIEVAQNYIYIENQFFTAKTISKALVKRLQDPDGPEIIINLPLKTAGWLSQQSMDMMRVSLLKELFAADKYHRLAVYYPHKDGLGEYSINLHAKLMIMDDCFVRVGSANLNNRSMKLDTECDLAIEAAQNDEHARQGIREFRNRLLAEHLDCTTEKLQAMISQKNSIIDSIETLAQKPRRLKPLMPELPEPDERTLQDISLTDPEHCIDMNGLLKHFIPQQQKQSTARRVTGWTLFLLMIIGVALLWRFTPLSVWLDVHQLAEMVSRWREWPGTPIITVAAFIAAGLLAVPVTVMIIVTTLVFGPLLGFVYAFIAAQLTALCGYGLGHLLGRKSVRYLAGKRINQVSQHLAKRGVLTMLFVRIVPVAPFALINLVAGASHIGLRDYIVGSALGMLPGIAAIALLSDRVQAALLTPDWQTILALVAIAFIVISVGYWLSKKMLMKVNDRD